MCYCCVPGPSGTSDSGPAPAPAPVRNGLLQSSASNTSIRASRMAVSEVKACFIIELRTLAVEGGKKENEKMGHVGLSDLKGQK